MAIFAAPFNEEKYCRMPWLYFAVLAAILAATAVRYHASTKRFTLQSTVFIATFSPCPTPTPSTALACTSVCLAISSNTGGYL
ncbi:hypothetical protein, partial [Rivihabitans pingtungensis]|uniref:hypothetical protein n=1 Tax=Rivihabitans pingtungensis TaxID=1054498 RepID=UPI002FDAA155